MLALPRLGSIRSRLRLRRAHFVGSETRALGDVWIHGGGRIWIGDRVLFDAESVPIELHVEEGATLTIGDDCVISGGTSIESTFQVQIGARARLGAFSKIMDNHFHLLVGDRTRRPEARPVVIDDDVTIGPWSIVFAGARVTRSASSAPRTLHKRAVGRS